MNKFITRVELHGASGSDYELLHSAMELEKFQRSILADDGSLYNLPTAEYYSFGFGISAADVRALAKRAAAKTQRAYWILVSEFSNAAWELKPVASARLNPLLAR